MQDFIKHSKKGANAASVRLCFETAVGKYSQHAPFWLGDSSSPSIVTHLFRLRPMGQKDWKERRGQGHSFESNPCRSKTERPVAGLRSSWALLFCPSDGRSQSRSTVQRKDRRATEAAVQRWYRIHRVPERNQGWSLKFSISTDGEKLCPRMPHCDWRCSNYSRSFLTQSCAWRGWEDLLNLSQNSLGLFWRGEQRKVEKLRLLDLQYAIEALLKEARAKFSTDVAFLNQLPKDDLNLNEEHRLYRGETIDHRLISPVLSFKGLDLTVHLKSIIQHQTNHNVSLSQNNWTQPSQKTNPDYTSPTYHNWNRWMQTKRWGDDLWRRGLMRIGHQPSVRRGHQRKVLWWGAAQVLHSTRRLEGWVIFIGKRWRINDAKNSRRKGYQLDAPFECSVENETTPGYFGTSGQ